jgi:PAS domain S-box-containing protein
MSQTAPFPAFAETAQPVALLRAENRILELATRNTPLPEILTELASSAEELAGEGALCSILLLDSDGQRLLHGAAPHLPQAYNEAIHGILIGPTVGSCGTAAATRQEVVVTDIATHPFWAPFKELAMGHGLRACWSTPIFSSQGAVLGTFAMYHSQPAEPSRVARQTVELLTKTAALVLERSRLYDELAHKIAEHEEAEDLLRTAQQAARVATWSWNAANDAMAFAAGSAEILSMPLADVSTRHRFLGIIRDEDRQRVSEAFLNGIEQQADFQVEFGIAEGESTRWIMVTGRPLADAQRLNCSAVGVCIDVTQRKNAEEALRSSEKLAATGRLAATIAHEINNPLEAVTNFIYLAKNNRELPLSVKRYLDVADRELARVAHIAQQTLGFYRDTSQPVRFDLATVLDDVLLLYERKLGYKGLQVKKQYKAGLYLTGLAGEMRQVISNLLANAIDACPDDAGISVRARVVTSRESGRKELRITIADEGCGMPQEVQARIFTPFFTTKQEVGTGLGLWVTRGIVEKHKGKLSFRSSTGAKPGTLFRIVVPTDPSGLARSN